MSWVFLGIFLIIGIVVGVFLKPFVGNHVIKFIPGDHRFIDYDIEEETAVSISCKKKKGYPKQRFFKYHPGFTGIMGKFIKKPVTRFLGIEGTAYTWEMKNGEYVDAGSFQDVLRAIWGEDFWDYVPEEQKNLLEDKKIKVTIGLDESPLTPEGYRPISEEDIKQEEDRVASRTFWSEHGAQIRGYLINLFLAGGTGFGIALALQILGILDMAPAPAPSPSPPPEVAAQIVAILGRILP